MKGLSHTININQRLSFNSDNIFFSVHTAYFNVRHPLTNKSDRHRGALVCFVHNLPSIGINDLLQSDDVCTCGHCEVETHMVV